MFSCQICNFFQDTYLVEQLRTAVSVWIFQKIFKSTNEKMLLVYIVHTAILKGNLHNLHSSLIKKTFNFRLAHVVPNFACPTNELKDYSDKPLKQKSVQRL